MLRNVILALPTYLCLSVASVAQDTRPVPPIPITISEEAQAFLRTPPRHGGARIHSKDS